MEKLFLKAFIGLFFTSTILTACGLMAPSISKAYGCKGELCDEIEKLKHLQSHDELAFGGTNGYFKLLKLLVQADQKEEAIEFQYQIPFKLIQPKNLEEFEVLVWKAHAALIPESSDRCIPNPLSRQCDEGQGTDYALRAFFTRFPESPFASEMISITKKYESYRTRHELSKLDKFIEAYEAAVHPKGVVAEYLNNTIRDNDKRSDGKVWANCVGPREEVEGKCDLVEKAELLRRIINQAYYVLEVVKFRSDANTTGVIQLINETNQKLNHYKVELKAL